MYTYFEVVINRKVYKGLNQGKLYIVERLNRGNGKMLGISGLEWIANTASRFPTTYNTTSISRRMFLRGGAATTAAGLLVACESPIEPKIEPHDPTLKLSVDKVQIIGRANVTVSWQATPGYQGASIDYVELNTGDGKPPTRHGANFSHSHIYQNPSQQPIKYDITGIAMQNDGRTGGDSVSVTVDPARLPTINMIKLTPSGSFDISEYKYDVTASAQDGLYMKSITIKPNYGSAIPPHLNPVQSASQTVTGTIPLPPSRGSLEKLVVEVEAKDEFGNSTKSTPQEIPITYVTINPRSFFGEGLEGLASEPLIKTKGTLVLEKDGRPERIDLEGARTLRLMPGEYKVRYENSNYHDPWALIREKGSDTNLSQSDITNPLMALNVGLEDKVLDLYKIPKSFKVQGYFDLIFDTRHEPGISRWKPGLPMTVYIYTGAAVGARGEKPSDEWVNGAKQAIGDLYQIKTTDGKQVFQNIDVKITDIAPKDDILSAFDEGSIYIYADNSTGFSGGNGTKLDQNGYVVKAAIFADTNGRSNIFRHELAQAIVDGASYNSPPLEISDTVYSRGNWSNVDNFRLIDLYANKLAYSFNVGTRFWNVSSSSSVASKDIVDITRYGMKFRVGNRVEGMKKAA